MLNNNLCTGTSSSATSRQPAITEFMAINREREETRLLKSNIHRQTHCPEQSKACGWNKL